MKVKNVNHIKEFEGLRLEAYPDPGSSNGEPWTIGYGHTNGVKKGDRIDEATAEIYLRQDLEWVENAIQRYVTVPLSQNQYDSLASFIFNVGVGNFRSSTLLKRLNARRYEDVPAQMGRWIYNDGKVMRGLIRRRAAEAELWKTPSVKNTPLPEPTRPTAPPKGKSALESTTNWAAGGSAVAGIIGALGTANTVVALALIVVAVGAAIWIWRERKIKSEQDGV